MGAHQFIIESEYILSYLVQFRVPIIYFISIIVVQSSYEFNFSFWFF